MSAVKSKASQDWDGFKHNSAVSNINEPLKWKLQSQNIIKGSSVCSWRCCNQHQRRDHCIYWWLQPLVLKEHQAMCASTTQLKALEECTDLIIWRQLQDHSPKCIHEMSFLDTQVQMKTPHVQASAVQFPPGSMSEKSPNLHSCKHAHDSDPPSVVNTMRSSDSSLSSLSTKWPVFILRSSKIRSLKVATASHIQSCWFHQAKSPSDSHTNTHHQSSFGLRGLSQLFSSILQGNQWLTSIASQSCQGTGCQQWSHHINCNCWTCVSSTPTNQWASWWVHVWEQQLKKQEESEGNEKESELRGKRNTQMETMKRKEGQDVDGKQEEWKTARNWKQKKQKRDKKLLHWRADALQHVLREGWWWQWTIFGKNQTAQQQWRQQIGSQVWWWGHKLEDSEPPNELIGGHMMALGQLI